ncbi:MAG: hypothetical protein J3K34DRAFT_381092 [Monoraphidium minutum]|nr:MAG: hypothetical protein J3K34DRAFT_381092 [Monoraphidium minutum]
MLQGGSFASALRACLGMAGTHDLVADIAHPAPGKLANVDGMAHLVAQIKHQIYDWDFNVFELDRRSGQRPLFAVVLALLEDQGLLDGWMLDRATVERYFAAVEAAYKQNPYHNNTHAADVTQTAAVIMRHTHAGEGGGGGLSKMERFCVIFASAVHDLGHPGVNDFLIRTRDKQAVIYNDRSVNENMHCARAFELALSRDGCDIFRRFADAEYARARALIVGMVLSTDMAVHFDLLNRFNAALEACPDPRSWGDKERALVLQMLVHLADLANPARPFSLAAAWAERVVTEFMRQGDQEAARGLGVSPFCDREKVCMPAAQMGFVKMFAGPTLDAFGAIAPGFVALAAPCLEETRLKWDFLQRAGVKHPAADGYPGGYPAFPADLLSEVARRRGEVEAEVGAAAAPRRAPAERGGAAGQQQQLPPPQQPQQPQASPPP